MKNYKVNTIYNEDSYKAIKRIEDNVIDCIYVDIPYLYRLSKSIKESTPTSKMDSNIKSVQRELLDADISSGINYQILDEFVRVMKKTNIFIWCSKDQLLDIMDYFKKQNCNFDLLVWCKTNQIPAVNNTWLPDIEYCLYFREVGVRLHDGYENKSKFNVSVVNKQDKELYGHPTIKPLDMVKKHLLHATKENDLVADFFLGSGTTAVASKELKRNFIGFEINKFYFKGATDRLNGINKGGQTSIFTDFDNMKK